MITKIKSICIVFVLSILLVSVSFGVPVGAVAVSGGEESSLVAAENGEVFSAGAVTGRSSNSDVFGRVLTGEMNTTTGYLENITGVGAGWVHALALTSGGQTVAWGDDSYGELGNGTDGASNYPVWVHAGEQNPSYPDSNLCDIIQVAAGRSGTHSLAIDFNGSLWSWGNNNMGQLGIGNQDSKTAPVHVLDGQQNTISGFLENIIAVSAGEEHSMALASDGSVYTFGDNVDIYSGYGKLGTNDTQNSYITTPVKVHGVNNAGYLQNIVAISAGWDHCMALQDYNPFEEDLKGYVYTWGNNGTGYDGNGGRLGDNSTTDRAYPVIVKAGEQNPSDPNGTYLEGVVAIGAGESHSTMLDANGFVLCVGSNRYGQLGNGTIGDSNDSLTPVYVKLEDGSRLRHIVKISAGYWHNLATDANGILYVWGSSASGKLGLGSVNNQPYAVPIHLFAPDVWNKTQDIHYEEIQLAINDANEGDLIIVTEGVYKEHPDFGGKRVIIQSSDPNNPDVVANTIIDAQGNNVLTFTDNLSSNGLVSIVEGITLRSGSYGVYCDTSDPIISKCVIEQCSNGVYAYDYSSPSIENCKIENNSSYGVYCYSSGVSLFDSVISGSSSSSYGIYSEWSEIYLENCLIEDNTYCGIYTGSYNDLYIYDSTISGNGQFGIYNYDYLEMDNSIVENHSEKGIYCQSGYLEITYCIVKDNSSDGIYCYDAPAFVYASLIEKNGGCGIKTEQGSSPHVENSFVRFNDGHGISFSQATSAIIKNNWIVNNGDLTGTDYGIYVYSPTSRPQIRNNTIAQNIGGGIYRSGGVDPNVVNCIIWDNGSQNLSGTFGILTYCCINGGHSGAGNISADPNFVSPDVNNFHIYWNSSCCNAGLAASDSNQETDIDGEQRVCNNQIDIGADEVYRSPADYDLSGIVNFVDFAIFASDWQSANENISLDDDNDIDIYDLELFCAEWLWQASWGMNNCPQNVGYQEYIYQSSSSSQSGENMMMSMQSQSESLLMESMTESIESIEETPVVSEVEPFDVNETLNWLDNLWQTDESIRNSMTESDWQDFLDAIKSSEQ